MALIQVSSNGVGTAADAATITLGYSDKWVQSITPTAARSLVLPAPIDGTPWFIRNAATVTGRTLTLTDPALVIDAGESYLIIGDAGSYTAFGPLSSTVAEVLDPGIGGELTTTFADSGVTSVNTGGSATTITLSIPSGAKVIGYAYNVTETITGSDATGSTLALTGGLTTSLATGLALAANTKSKGFLDANAASIITGGTTNASLTLTGGTPTNPSAGSVRLVAIYETIADLDSV